MVANYIFRGKLIEYDQATNNRIPSRQGFFVCVFVCFLRVLENLAWHTIAAQ